MEVRSGLPKDLACPVELATCSTCHLCNKIYNFFYIVGVYFTSRVESVKFVDFCGKYRLPLMQYLCSPTCTEMPVVSCQSDTETDDEDSAKAMMRRVLLG